MPSSKLSNRPKSPLGAFSWLPAAAIISKIFLEVSGCPGLALIITGQPAAIAEAVSPPPTPNPKGKLLAPNTPTIPIGIFDLRRSGFGGCEEESAKSIDICR